MSKEAEYRRQMEALGVWQDAFAAEVHQLAIMERELSRTMKAWKATAKDGGSPSVLDPHYPIIVRMRSDILMHRDSLGLTPKGLRRLKKGAASESGATGETLAQKLDGLMAQVQGYDVVSGDAGAEF